jgi:hypothetical protein
MASKYFVDIDGFIHTVFENGGTTYYNKHFDVEVCEGYEQVRFLLKEGEEWLVYEEYQLWASLSSLTEILEQGG